MHEIDLIPRSYRQAREQRRYLSLTAWAAAAIVGVITLAWGSLNVANKGLAEEIEALQRQQTISGIEQEELQALTNKKSDYQQQLGLLLGLRSGTAAENLFHIVDAALVEDSLWFRKWQFRRAGNAGPSNAQAVETGYFVVVPEGASEGEDAWRVETHMQINGQATDHAALSAFVKRLFMQPEIFDVRVKRTELKRYRAGQVVDFDLAVVINTGVAG